ncbi:hypothetical protein Rumeso_02079 [Rubellimicrobium mesophilum DSM 19309]|uniref:Uncharacterized protein n=1 Tax=Rubellimicrobium mesophilum DSM 19309 TaxID=442562 RepID=A0A017HPK9_9RHOB|nr:hypothetical protein [Rubellimicrobium mesophilum]EYD76321.1 hypothetical protein Rumeso_02079 [Rubellimicrobium mesophilum DSM 19309]
MTSRLQGWTAIGVAVAWALAASAPARADVVVGAAVWTCEHEGSDQATARLDLTKLSSVDVDEQGVRLSAADEPFDCSFPWGQLQIDVTGYNSPRDNMSCGAAEAWGLRVTANGQVLQDIPADSARACHLESYNPFEGWVEADAEGVVVCQAQRDGSPHDCVTTGADEF